MEKGITAKSARNVNIRQSCFRIAVGGQSDNWQGGRDHEDATGNDGFAGNDDAGTATVHAQNTKSPAAASTSPSKASRPNILVIWGDDVGIWNISAYHRGMMGGTTPCIDRIAKEGIIFMDHYAQASCTAGRASFITGQYPVRAV